MAVLSGENLELRYNTKTLEFVGADSVCKINLCADEYPNVKGQIQKSLNGVAQHITLKTAQLKSALARVTALPNQSSDYPLRLDVSESIVLSYNFGTGTYSDEVECKLDGDPFTVGVKTSFLADALRAAGDSVIMDCSGEKGAIIVNSGNMQQMLMPVRLKK